MTTTDISEDSCYFVSSRGLLKSTDIHDPDPGSSTESLPPDMLTKLKRGSTVYVCTSALKALVKVLDQIKEPFILVTGDSDCEVSEESSTVQTLLSSPKIYHWFAQNLTFQHFKVTHMPIGIDYHTISRPGEVHPWGKGQYPVDQEKILMQYCTTSEQTRRIPICYANWHHAIWGIGSRGDRPQCKKEVPSNCVYYEPEFTCRETSWKNQQSFSFVLSPKGGGLDCHRTWEAIILGCIPIIKSSGLNPLFRDLPVYIVDEWSDITQETLQKATNNLANKDFNFNKITLKFWKDLFKLLSDECKFMNIE